ncbi:hypothetical protein SBBP2_570066 [Burkholderiales bacterium]|nr:hypothetical protein SBBP2_570066 [Burkholderiales bacterium]
MTTRLRGAAPGSIIGPGRSCHGCRRREKYCAQAPKSRCLVGNSKGAAAALVFRSSILPPGYDYRYHAVAASGTAKLALRGQHGRFALYVNRVNCRESR